MKRLLKIFLFVVLTPITGFSQNFSSVYDYTSTTIGTWEVTNFIHDTVTYNPSHTEYFTFIEPAFWYPNYGTIIISHWDSTKLNFCYDFTIDANFQTPQIPIYNLGANQLLLLYPSNPYQDDSVFLTKISDVPFGPYQIIIDTMFFEDSISIVENIVIVDTITSLDSTFILDTISLNYEIYLNDTLVVTDTIIQIDTIFIIDTVHTRIFDKAQISEVRVYPTVFENEIYCDFTHTNLKGELDYHIYTNNGKLVYQNFFFVRNDIVSIRLEKLEKGDYFIQFIEDGQTIKTDFLRKK